MIQTSDATAPINMMDNAKLASMVSSAMFANLLMVKRIAMGPLLASTHECFMSINGWKVSYTCNYN